jgi:ribosomal protein L37AE/L43A
MTGRAVPYHCPFCGEENLRPAEAHGAWECHSCLRSFSLTMLGMLPHPRWTAAASPDSEVAR